MGVHDNNNNSAGPTDEGNAVGSWAGGWLDGEWKCPQCWLTIGRNLRGEIPHHLVRRHVCDTAHVALVQKKRRRPEMAEKERLNVDDWRYFSKVAGPEVIDGDTVRFEKVQLPFGLELSPQKCPGASPFTIRLCGVDAYESSKRERQTHDQILLGLITKEYLSEVLRVEELFVRTYATDAFGRWLSDLYLGARGNVALVSVSQLLLLHPGLVERDGRSEAASHVLEGSEPFSIRDHDYLQVSFGVLQRAVRTWVRRYVPTSGPRGGAVSRRMLLRDTPRWLTNQLGYHTGAVEFQDWSSVDVRDFRALSRDLSDYLSLSRRA